MRMDQLLPSIHAAPQHVVLLIYVTKDGLLRLSIIMCPLLRSLVFVMCIG
jgi:hypothetical protein